MKKILLFALFICLNGVAFGQLDQFRMIGSGSWAVVNDSTFSSTVTIQADLTANGFLPTSITTGEKIFSQTGQVYRISSVANATFSSVDLIIVENGGDWGTPTGQVMIYDPDGRTAIPSIPFGATGATAKMQEAIDSYNSVIIGVGAEVTQSALNDSTSAIRADFPIGAGATTFFDLTDTPSSYTGEANKVLMVNPGETALIFVDTTGFGSGGGGASSVPEIGPEYPYDTIAYSKSYALDIGGTANFNGGSRVYVADSSAMMITNGVGGSKGVEISDFTHIGNVDYTVRLDVKDPGNGVRLYAQWSSPIVETTEPGVFYWNFTSPSSGGAFGKEIIIVPFDSNPDTIYINSITIYEKNQDYNILPKEDISALVLDSINSITPGFVNSLFSSSALEKTDLLYTNDFDINSDGVSCFACSGSIINSQYQAVTTAGGQIVTIGADVLDSIQYYKVSVDVEIVDSIIFIRSVWGGTSENVTIDSITKTNRYDFLMKKKYTNNLSQLDGLCFYTKAGGTIRLDNVILTTFPTDNFDTFFPEPGSGFNNVFVEIGQAANTGGGSQVAIGRDATAILTQGIAIGDSAKAVFLDLYGGTSGPESVAIGENSVAGAWRAVALGGNAYAGTTSSTAIGAGATALSSHAVALGRGAYAPHPDTVGFEVETVIGGSGSTNLWIANGWGHQFNTPEGGLVIGSIVPSSTELKIHGQDAFDAKNIPDDFNISGGDLGIYAGRATGTGVSGDINFYNAEGDNGSNTKDTDILSGAFVSDGTLADGTHLWLRDESDNTLRRARIQKDSSLYLGTTQVEDYGSASGTTDVNGDLTVSHSLGSASIFVTATGTGTTFYNVQVHTKTTTTFKVRFFDAAGSAITSTSVAADWFAKK